MKVCRFLYLYYRTLLKNQATQDPKNIVSLDENTIDCTPAKISGAFEQIFIFYAKALLSSVRASKIGAADLEPVSVSI